MPIVDAQVHIWSGGKPKNPSHRQRMFWGTDIRAICDWLGWKPAGGA